MKVPWSTRKAEDAGLRQAIARLEAAAASAAESAMAARRASDDALSSLRAIESVEEDATAGRTLRLAAVCVGFLLCAGFLTAAGADAFADPAAISVGFDSVTLAVAVPRPSQSALYEPSSSIDIYVDAFFEQNANDYAEYYISVPAGFAGRKFILLLEGSARISDPKAIGGGVIESRSVECHYGIEAAEATGPCQLISGRIGNQHPIVTTGIPCLDEKSFFGLTDYRHVTVDVGGYSHIRTSATWAYQSYTLPSLTGDNSDSYLSGWAGIPLDGWYRTGHAIGCRNDILPVWSELTNVYEPATLSVLGQLIWKSQNSIGTAAIILRRRDAGAIGNGLIALGAAMAALAIGFVPITYEANRSRKRARRRRSSLSER